MPVKSWKRGTGNWQRGTFFVFVKKYVIRRLVLVIPALWLVSVLHPEGHVLQLAGERETILTEVIDLDLVHRVREYGTLGLSQLWKDLRSFRKKFPIYQQGVHRGKIFESLGNLKQHRKIQ